MERARTERFGLIVGPFRSPICKFKTRRRKGAAVALAMVAVVAAARGWERGSLLTKRAPPLVSRTTTFSIAARRAAPEATAPATRVAAEAAGSAGTAE